MVGVCRGRHGGLVHVALGFARLGVKPLYLTLYLHCIQTWAGNIVSQCIHRHYALYLASRLLLEVGQRRVEGLVGEEHVCEEDAHQRRRQVKGEVVVIMRFSMPRMNWRYRLFRSILTLGMESRFALSMGEVRCALSCPCPMSLLSFKAPGCRHRGQSRRLRGARMTRRPANPTSTVQMATRLRPQARSRRRSTRSCRRPSTT